MQSQSLTPQLSFSLFLDPPLNCFGPQTYQVDCRISKTLKPFVFEGLQWP
jgi:hypothetical protein